ncbi:MAG: nucleotidyl transferase AbiEii/AbiGii toxin family protein [Gammaproteobacteria bacterium]
MKLTSLIAVAAALQDADVRYLVAGGVAVNAHGYQRLTQDLDLVIQLNRENVMSAFSALASLGYRPLVPVTAEGFADNAQREQWIHEKGMTVLNFHSDQHALTPLNVFVSEPFDFDTEFRSATPGEVAPGLYMRFVSIPTLIVMKERAGRPRDLDDIQHLRWIFEELQKGVHES